MSEDKKGFEFKDTLNLPQTTLAMRANATIRELEIQDFWEMKKVYQKGFGLYRIYYDRQGGFSKRNG